MTRERACALDEAVLTARDALDFAGAAAPQALFLLGTGASTLVQRLRVRGTIELGTIGGVPARWRGALLHHGAIETESRPLGAWLVDDTSGDAHAEDEAPWEVGFPLWLAASAGATQLVHTSAGQALAPEGRSPLPVGAIACVQDHLNLSGASPLVGLAGSKLGPLFPDLTRLHHARLRAAALAHAQRLGVDAREAVAACTPGPTRETPAERRFFARAGADVSVQGLAGPLLAAAHAGLAALALVAVVDDGGESDLASLVAAATAAAPALEDLVFALTPDLMRAAGAMTGLDA